MPVRNQDYFLLAGSKIALSHAATHLNMIHSWATHKAGTKKPRVTSSTLFENSKIGVQT